MNDCKICTSEIKNEIESLLNKNVNLSWLQKYLNKKDLEVSIEEIETHFYAHMNNESKEEKTKVQIKTIDYKDYLEKFNGSDNKVILKSITQIMLKNLAIIDSEINQHMEGMEDYPKIKIDGLKVLNDIRKLYIQDLDL